MPQVQLDIYTLVALVQHYSITYTQNITTEILSSVLKIQISSVTLKAAKNHNFIT